MLYEVITAKDSKMIQLKHFAKTALLKPGESETLKFQITAEDLAGYDSSQKAWIAEPGTYDVLIGASSEDIRLRTEVALDQQVVF